MWSKQYCGKTAVVDGYCRMHHPEAVAARRAKSSALWDAKRAEFRRKLETNERAVRAMEIVRQIAAGHNDPRALCIDLLDAYKHLDSAISPIPK